MLGIVLMLIIQFVLFGPIGITIWAVQMAWIPFFAAGIINGVGHYWGYRNWSTEDASTNIVPWGIIIGGEELHNNHHAYATSAKLSNKWYEFDIGWMYIRLLEVLGLAQVKKVAPTPRFTDPKPAVDSETLEAVITHRYDVLAKYAKSLKHTYTEELSKLRRLAPHDVHVVQSLKRWLHRDEKSLCETDRACLRHGLSMSRALQTVYSMRAELLRGERSGVASARALRTCAGRRAAFAIRGVLPAAPLRGA
jgi:stearoyl-CoA desaturase (delta-9 desaturase)